MPHSSIYPPMLYVLNSRGNVLISLLYLQVLAGIDVDKPHQMSLRAEYNITGFPTLYYFEYVLSHSAFVYTVIFNTFFKGACHEFNRDIFTMCMLIICL